MVTPPAGPKGPTGPKVPLPAKPIVELETIGALANQPSKAPTQKVIAGGVTGILIAAATGLLARFTGIKITPDDIGILLAAYGMALAVVAQVGAYLKRDKAKVVKS